MKETKKRIKDAISKKDLLSGAPIAHAVGRRKSSVARVFLRHGTGEIVVNTKAYTSYFHTDVAKKAILEPFAVTQANEIFNITVNVKGGGTHSQADACKLAIARALTLFNADEYKAKLKAAGLLTVDARLKERKKPGRKAARRSFQFVKR